MSNVNRIRNVQLNNAINHSQPLPVRNTELQINALTAFFHRTVEITVNITTGICKIVRQHIALSFLVLTVIFIALWFFKKLPSKIQQFLDRVIIENRDIGTGTSPHTQRIQKILPDTPVKNTDKESG
jgi:hypothetical protein